MWLFDCFFFKQKTAYEMRISDWSSDVCSSDLKLVDLVQQEQWIGRPRLAQVLDDLAGHGADVRPAVAANLGLVAHAAQRMADELPSRRAGDRAAKRCLAHARRTDEAQYRQIGRAHV